MDFNKFPWAIKVQIASYFSPSDWLNTTRVSKEWFELTMKGVRRIKAHHTFILDDVADFVNSIEGTNYTFVSLLAKMPNLEQLECLEHGEDFWTQVRPIFGQLKSLTILPLKPVNFNNLNITFDNLIELSWNGGKDRIPFPLKIFEVAPKLQTLSLINIRITKEWENMIPKTVKNLILIDVDYSDTLDIIDQMDPLDAIDP